MIANALRKGLDLGRALLQRSDFFIFQIEERAEIDFDFLSLHFACCCTRSNSTKIAKMVSAPLKRKSPAKKKSAKVVAKKKSGTVVKKSTSRKYHKMKKSPLKKKPGKKKVTKNKKVKKKVKKEKKKKKKRERSRYPKPVFVDFQSGGTRYRPHRVRAPLVPKADFSEYNDLEKLQMIIKSQNKTNNGMDSIEERFVYPNK